MIHFENRDFTFWSIIQFLFQNHNNFYVQWPNINASLYIYLFILFIYSEFFYLILTLDEAKKIYASRSIFHLRQFSLFPVLTARNNLLSSVFINIPTFEWLFFFFFFLFNWNSTYVSQDLDTEITVTIFICRRVFCRKHTSSENPSRRLF